MNNTVSLNSRISAIREFLTRHVNAVYEAQVDSNGILRDPNTKEVIDWRPGEPRKGIVDFGHIQGKSYKKIFESYKNGVLTLEELKAFQSNPANFQIEVPKSNRSHKYE